MLIKHPLLTVVLILRAAGSVAAKARAAEHERRRRPRRGYLSVWATGQCAIVLHRDRWTSKAMVGN